MGNEKFVNYYIENLIATMNDCLIRNISLQVNERISKEAIEDQSKAIEDLQNTIESLKKENHSLQDNRQVSDQEKYQNLENSIKEHLNTIRGLNERIAEADKLKNEYENVKHQVQHVDTFRNELIKTQKELEEVKSQNVSQQSLNDQVNRLQAELTNSQNIIIQKNGIIEKINIDRDKTIAELSEKIEYLQLTPAKRKKIDEERAKEIEAPASDLFVSDTLDRDGGSF